MMKVKSKNLAHSFMSLALAVAMTLPVFAQGTTDGTIAGVAQDAQGAVVAEAKVTAKNSATGRIWTVTTADNGAFRINNVPVGIYTVTVEAENFKTYSNADVQVQLNRVTDFTSTLEPGAVSEVVTVTAGAASIPI